MKMRKSYVLLVSLCLFLIFLLLKMSYEAHTDVQKFVQITKHNANNEEIFSFYKKNYSLERVNRKNAHSIKVLESADDGVFKRDIKKLLSEKIMPITLSEKEQFAVYDYFHCYLQNGPQEIHGISQFSLIRYNKSFEEISEAEKKWLDDFCTKCARRRTECRIKNLTDDWKKVTVDFIQKRNRNKAQD